MSLFFSKKIHISLFSLSYPIGGEDTSAHASHLVKSKKEVASLIGLRAFHVLDTALRRREFGLYGMHAWELHHVAFRKTTDPLGFELGVRMHLDPFGSLVKRLERNGALFPICIRQHSLFGTDFS